MPERSPPCEGTSWRPCRIPSIVWRAKSTQQILAAFRCSQASQVHCHFRVVLAQPMPRCIFQVWAWQSARALPRRRGAAISWLLLPLELDDLVEASVSDDCGSHREVPQLRSLLHAHHSGLPHTSLSRLPTDPPPSTGSTAPLTAPVLQTSVQLGLKRPWQLSWAMRQSTTLRTWRIQEKTKLWATIFQKTMATQLIALNNNVHCATGTTRYIKDKYHLSISFSNIFIEDKYDLSDSFSKYIYIPSLKQLSCTTTSTLTWTGDKHGMVFNQDFKNVFIVL